MLEEKDLEIQILRAKKSKTTGKEQNAGEMEIL
jgi:hypothetical protein